MKLKFLVIFGTLSAVLCDTYDNSAIVVGQNILPNSTLRATIFLNEQELYDENLRSNQVIVKVKSHASNDNKCGATSTPYELSKGVIVFPNRATDVDLEIGDVSPGIYEISVLRGDKILLKSELRYCEAEVKVKIFPLPLFKFRGQAGTWWFLAQNGAKLDHVDENDLEFFVIDKEQNVVASGPEIVTIQNLGLLMIVRIYLDYKIVPGGYSLVVTYKAVDITRHNFLLLDYKPGSFNVNVEQGKRDGIEWNDLKIRAFNLNGDGVEGDVTIEVDNNPELTTSIPILEGQTTYIMGPVKEKQDVKVTVRDRRTGETNSNTVTVTSSSFVSTENRQIRPVINEKYISGIPFMEKFEISGFDEHHVRNSNETVKFIYCFSDSEDEKFTDELKIGKFLDNNKFEVEVNHLFPTNDSIYYTVKYGDVEYSYDLYRYPLDEPIIFRSRKISDDHLNTFEVFCTESMDRVTYVIRSKDRDKVKSQTVPVNNKRIFKLQIDYELKPEHTIVFLYYSRRHMRIVTSQYSNEIKIDETDDEIKVKYNLENEEVLIDLEYNLKAAIPIVMVVDNRLAQMEYLGFPDYIYTQQLVSGNGLIEFKAMPEGSKHEKIGPFLAEGTFTIVVVLVTPDGVKTPKNGTLDFAIHRPLRVKTNAPNALYCGEMTHIEIIVSNRHHEAGVVSLAIHDRDVIEFLLSANETKAINYTVTAISDITVSGHATIKYSGHERSIDFKTEIPVEDSPISIHDYHFIDSSTEKVLDDHSIFYGRRLIDHIFDQSKIKFKSSPLSSDLMNRVKDVIETISENDPPSNKNDTNIFRRKIFDLFRHQNDDGTFGEKPHRDDIWLTAFIVRMLCASQSTNFNVIDNKLLEKSIELVFRSGDPLQRSHLKIVEMTTRPVAVRRALTLVMLLESEDAQLDYPILITDLRSDLINFLKETDDIIAKVLMIYALISVNDSRFTMYQQKSENLKIMYEELLSIAQRGQEMIWWEVPFNSSYTKEELRSANLELTSFASLATARFPTGRVQPMVNYLLSHYNQNVPLIYWEALVRARDAYPSDGNSSVPGGFFTPNSRQHDEKLDHNLSVEIKSMNDSIEVCVHHENLSGDFVVELYLPSGWNTVTGVLDGHLQMFELKLTQGHGCHTAELYRLLNVQNPIMRLPVVVYQKHHEEKRNIYYHNYSTIALKL